jgi:hypothetical protein
VRNLYVLTDRLKFADGHAEQASFDAQPVEVAQKFDHTYEVCLRKIAACIIKLDMAILYAVEEAHKLQDYSTFDKDERVEIKQSLHEEECVKFFYNRRFFRSDIRYDEDLNRHAQMSMQQLINRINDTRTVIYLSKMIEEMLSLFYTSRQQVNEGRDITNVYEGRGRVYGAYLTLLYGVVLDLRGATFDIMSRDVLDDVSAVALKSRMEALQENFTGLWLKMGSSKAGYKQPVLVYDSPTWWYAISNDGSFLRIHLTLRDRKNPLIMKLTLLKTILTTWKGVLLKAYILT